MRTALFLFAGVLLLAAFYILAKLFATQYPGSSTVAVVLFVLLWFAVSAFNMWTGVAKAGYAWTEELPIFLLILGVPAALAVIAGWKLG
jgi:hypothetical protein